MCIRFHYNWFFIVSVRTKTLFWTKVEVGFSMFNVTINDTMGIHILMKCTLCENLSQKPIFFSERKLSNKGGFFFQ